MIDIVLVVGRSRRPLHFGSWTTWVISIGTLRLTRPVPFCLSYGTGASNHLTLKDVKLLHLECVDDLGEDSLIRLSGLDAIPGHAWCSLSR